MKPLNCENPKDRLEIAGKSHDFEFETFNAAKGVFEQHSLYEFLKQNKWVVLFFYPGDFTFICPTELADMANEKQKFIDMGVEIVTMSTDSKYAHLSWHRSEKLLEKVDFQMGSDPTGCIARYFGVYDEGEGTAYRGTFLINPDGILTGKEINYYNVGRNAAELVRKLEASTHLRKNPNEACPARWTPGQKTLVPSEGMVGNVFTFYTK